MSKEIVYKDKTKIAIVGSRSFNDYESLESAVFCNFPDFGCIISGGAKGADSLAKKLALKYNINYKEFLPDWDKYGKSAGFIRNKQIIDECDVLIAFWDGESKGTKHSIDLANKANKQVIIIRFYIKEDEIIIE